MSRFSIDLKEVKEELPLVPVGIYPARITKGEVNTGVKDDFEWANFNVTLVINDPELASSLGVDEVNVYFRGMFSFSRDDDSFQANRCPELGNFIKTLGYTDENEFQTQETEDAESEREYVIALAKAMFDAAIGSDVMVKVGHQAYSKTNKKIVSYVEKLMPME